MKTRIILAIICATLAGCESLRIRGVLETEHGSIESDGKTVTVRLRPTQGYLK